MSRDYPLDLLSICNHLLRIILRSPSFVFLFCTAGYLFLLKCNNNKQSDIHARYNFYIGTKFSNAETKKKVFVYRNADKMHKKELPNVTYNVAIVSYE